ncbi:BQ2448_5326 [Microbotryum intermedium]|uniref:BQ2448_5326 protein n=1 Tax=Microbotryum intermedium TaxID=269621 RepID=A0A238F3W0_9BASI|nr:BQ2448_5326 [Microbotryum intermedium]
MKRELNKGLIRCRAKHLLDRLPLLPTFLDDHGLTQKVLAKARELLNQDEGSDRLFCTAKPECQITIHDWRIRVLEPLVMFLLQEHHEKTGVSMKLEFGPNPRYPLTLRQQAPPEPAGVTFALADISKGTHLSSVRIQFDLDSNFLSFGPQPNLFVRADQCQYHLEAEGPIPLDPNGKSHGAQAMLNKLALKMEHFFEHHPKTFDREQQTVPVRFGMIMSTRMVLFAEMGNYNRHNPQQVGLLYSPLFQTTMSLGEINRKAPRSFHCSSVTLMFLATILEHLIKVDPPSPTTVERLFGARGHAPPEGQAAALPVPTEDATESGQDVATMTPAKRRRKNDDGESPPSPPPPVDAWVTPYFRVQMRFDSAMFPDGGEDPFALPHLDAAQLVGEGGSSNAFGARFFLCGAYPASSPGSYQRSIPLDKVVVIKSFNDRYFEFGIRESLFYEEVFPLLPTEARAYLPPYYRTFRCTDVREIALILGYGGRPIQKIEHTEELKPRISNAFENFDKYGIDHGDRELRNVLLRDDGSLCSIDWNLL